MEEVLRLQTEVADVEALACGGVITTSSSGSICM